MKGALPGLIFDLELSYSNLRKSTQKIYKSVKFDIFDFLGHLEGFSDLSMQISLQAYLRSIFIRFIHSRYKKFDNVLKIT